MSKKIYQEYFFDEPTYDTHSDSFIPFEEKISNQRNRLAIPPLLEPEQQSEELTVYKVVAQEGETEIFPEKKTKTWGYNGSLLGPTIVFEKGKNYEILLENQLPEATTYHWHGLNVSGPVIDGGPHASIAPNAKSSIEFKVDQPASTAWLHPHPCPTTAEQVWKGLAAMVLIKDEQEASLPLPRTYGIDDLPLVLQDRSFHDYQLDYAADYNVDGTFGKVPLINGTVNPYFDVTTQRLRLRLLNGANRREFRLHFSDNLVFQQVASDGGILSEPVNLTKLMLTNGERAEIVLDFKDYHEGQEIVLFHDDTPFMTFKIGNFLKEIVELPKQLVPFDRLVVSSTTKVEKIILSGMKDFVKIDDQLFDMHRIDKLQKQGEIVIWEVVNINPKDIGMIHPFHIHGTQFQVLSRNGSKPYPNEHGWKDTIGINAEETVQLAVKFDTLGVFMYHCHILEHEDTGMMAQIKVYE